MSRIFVDSTSRVWISHCHIVSIWKRFKWNSLIQKEFNLKWMINWLWINDKLNIRFTNISWSLSMTLIFYCTVYSIKKVQYTVSVCLSTVIIVSIYNIWTIRFHDLISPAKYRQNYKTLLIVKIIYLEDEGSISLESFEILRNN